MRIARRSVSPILFAVLIGMAFPAHGGDEPAERREQKEIFPAIQSIPKGSFELLITDDPVEKYDDRKILDRAKVEFAKTNEWQSLKLTGDKPGHRFNVKLRHTGWVMEVQLEVVLHDKLRRSLVIRNRADIDWSTCSMMSSALTGQQIPPRLLERALTGRELCRFLRFDLRQRCLGALQRRQQVRQLRPGQLERGQRFQHRDILRRRQGLLCRRRQRPRRGRGWRRRLLSAGRR